MRRTRSRYGSRITSRKLRYEWDYEKTHGLDQEQRGGKIAGKSKGTSKIRSSRRKHEEE